MTLANRNLRSLALLACALVAQTSVTAQMDARLVERNKKERVAKAVLENTRRSINVKRTRAHRAVDAVTHVRPIVP